MRAFIILAALAFTPPAFAAGSFAGDWAGAGVTRGYPDTFKMKIHIYDDGSAKISYDGHNGGDAYQCDGLLLPMEKTRRTRVFREKITAGSCIDGATVTLIRRGPGAAAWAWSGEYNGKPVTAKGAVSLDK